MKKLLTLLFALFVSSTMFAGIVKFDGNFEQINGSGVTGAYVGYFDYTQKNLIMSGLVDSVGVRLSTNAKDAYAPIPTTPVTSGILYGSNDFNFFSLKNLINDLDVFKLKISTQEYYISIANNLSVFNFATSGIDLGKNYTVIINNGAIPVAYTTFTAVPEPTVAVSAAGMGLLGFGLFRIKQKNK